VYSSAFDPCTPRLFVSTAFLGNQSIGKQNGFTPAPWTCTHRRWGARSAAVLSKSHATALTWLGFLYRKISPS